MGSPRVTLSLCLVAVLFCFIQPAAGDVYPIIIHGKVTMADGSPPPFTAGIERACSDLMGSAPGPTTNKKGEFLWRMDVDPLAVRACVLRATHQGYISTSIDISALDTTKTEAFLPPLVLSVPSADPAVIHVSEENVPLRAKSSFEAAMKALDKPDYADAASKLEAAVKNSAKFAEGWHALGVVDEQLGKTADARAAYEHAVESDPKFFRAYVMLARVCIKTSNWACAAKTADDLLKADKKQTYPEIYLHQAVARYGMKDLNGAEMSIQEAIRLDPGHRKPREEYVLGRILEAKGDVIGAREHMKKYLELEPAPLDVDQVKTHLENVGKPEAGVVDPSLEVL
ncbi:MAG TPA: tetratricopeptide repeat protein [Bryobacteraceae bacterium]|jgi:Tfp pilus assembly protein PilF|nr:tetratricopeptide repeat protein [Bryobacteraceae bacterium]